MTPRTHAHWPQRLRSQMATALLAVSRLADHHGPGWALTRQDIRHAADADWIDTEWAPTEWPDTCVDPTLSGLPEDLA